MSKRDVVQKFLEEATEKDIEEVIKIVKYNKLCAFSYKISKFNELLKEIRLFVGLSQEEFSEILGIDRTTMSRYELGERSIPLNIIDKVLDEFNLKIVIQERNELEEEYMLDSKEEREEFMKNFLKEYQRKNQK